MEKYIVIKYDLVIQFYIYIRPHLVPHVNVDGVLGVAAVAVVALVIRHHFFFLLRSQTN